MWERESRGNWEFSLLQNPLPFATSKANCCWSAIDTVFISLSASTMGLSDLVWLTLWVDLCGNFPWLFCGPLGHLSPCWRCNWLFDGPAFPHWLPCFWGCRRCSPRQCLFGQSLAQCHMSWVFPKFWQVQHGARGLLFSLEAVITARCYWFCR